MQVSTMNEDVVIRMKRNEVRLLYKLLYGGATEVPTEVVAKMKNQLQSLIGLL